MGEASAAGPNAYVESPTGWSEVSAADELRTRFRRCEGFHTGVLHRVVHDEDIRARERSDVAVRRMHAVGVEHDRSTGRSFEHVDAVFVGEVAESLTIRGARTLHDK